MGLCPCPVMSSTNNMMQTPLSTQGKGARNEKEEKKRKENMTNSPVFNAAKEVCFGGIKTLQTEAEGRENKEMKKRREPGGRSG